MATVTALHPSNHQIEPVPPHQAPLDSLPSAPRASASSPSSGVHQGPVSATLNFYEPPKDGSAPFNYVEAPPPGSLGSNHSAAPVDVSINDIRNRESTFTIEKQAFAALQNQPHNPSINWDSEASVKEHYYPEVERILLDNLPGSPNRVLIFDHTIRRADPKAQRGPVMRAHIDQTASSAKQRVELHLPDEAPTLLKGRYRLVNVWRPLNGQVESHPLAFADSSTVPDDDIVPVQHRYPTRTGETAAVKYNPAHRWYYWSGVGNDERLLLQCFDSEGRGSRVPHSAFVDPRSGVESKPRESIEVRALVFG